MLFESVLRVAVSQPPAHTSAHMLTHKAKLRHERSKSIDRLGVQECKVYNRQIKQQAMAGVLICVRVPFVSLSNSAILSSKSAYAEGVTEKAEG